MRVYVRTDRGMVFWIPIPAWILKLGTGKTVENMVKRYVPEESRQYVDCINFGELRYVVDVLQDYKGLEIVNVHAKDGTTVSVKL